MSCNHGVELKGLERPGGVGKGLFDSGCECGEMAHFAAWARGQFAVEVQFDVRDGGSGGPIWFALRPLIAQQVDHSCGGELGGRSEWKAADGA